MEHVEQGSEAETETMAKITKHGGPSDVTQDPPGDSPAPVVGKSEPEVVETPDYDAWTVEGLRDELGKRALPKTGNKAELVQRLQADNKRDGTDG